jgi:AhpC/TSA family
MERAVGLVIGSPAPDLTLRTSSGRRRTLADLRGAPVVLAFADGWCGAAEEAMSGVQARLKSMNASAIVVCEDVAWFARPEASAVEVFARPGEITMRTYRSEPAGRRGVTVVVVDVAGVVRFANSVSARRDDEALTDALAEALAAATRRLRAAQELPKPPVEDWMVVSLLANFVLAFLERPGRRLQPTPRPRATATAA